MKVQPPPQVGDRLFLFHREVIITKTYLTFHLVELDTDKYHKLEIADKAFKRFEKMGSREVSD